MKSIYEVAMSPKEIAIPVRFNLEDVGTYQTPNGHDLEVTVDNAHGTLVYKEGQGLTDTPIPFSEIFKKIAHPLLYLFIIYLLHKFMQTAINNEPFNALNAGRMQWIGIALITIGLLKGLNILSGMSFLAETLNSNIIIHTEKSSAYYFGFAMAMLFRTEVITGLCALFFGKVMKHGIKIQQENELTI